MSFSGFRRGDTVLGKSRSGKNIWAKQGSKSLRPKAMGGNLCNFECNLGLAMQSLLELLPHNGNDWQCLHTVRSICLQSALAHKYDRDANGFAKLIGNFLSCSNPDHLYVVSLRQKFRWARYNKGNANRFRSTNRGSITVHVSRQDGIFKSSLTIMSRHPSMPETTSP